MSTGHPLPQRRQLLLALAAAGVLAACATSQPEPLVIKTYHETLSSLATGIDAWTSATPLDTIKTRLGQGYTLA